MIGNDDAVNAINRNNQHIVIGSDDTVGLIDSNAAGTLAESMSDLTVAESAFNGVIFAPTCHSTPVEPDKRPSKIGSGARRGGNQLRCDLADYYSSVEQHLFERPDTLTDQELLELILHIALGGRDARRLARALLARYRTLGGVISSLPDDLSAVRGLGKKGVIALKLIKASAVHLLRSEISTTPVLSCWDHLIDYLSVSLKHERVEHFRVLFLDGRRALIADEIQGRGTIDRAPVYPREIVRRCLELNASSIILVHNHPSGHPTPSHEDAMVTQSIQRAAGVMGIELIDHVIIGRFGSLSIRPGPIPT